MTDFWNRVHAVHVNSEADVEFQVIEPLLEALGYDRTDISPKHPIVFQEGRRGRKHEADYMVFHGPFHDRKTSVIAVEAKAPNESFEDAKAQAESYASNANVRAPFLLITDGIEFEIWQLQPIMDSICVFKDTVVNLASKRGELEGLIGKDAVLPYLRSLQHKSILAATKDLGTYETAEVARTSGAAVHVERTLSRTGGLTKLASSSLATKFPAGAIVVAPSGLGKTTLSQHLHREAIAARWRAQKGRISIEIALPDVADSKTPLLTFARERVEAHCPAVGDARFRDMLRTDGAIFHCDGFDRIPAEEQRRIEVELKNVLRDFPAIQMFVFARKSSQPTLDLPTLTIEELTPEQQVEFQRAVLPALTYDVLSQLPLVLRQRCGHPLLLKLILEHFGDTGRLPTDLPILFASWLDRTLSWQDEAAVARVERERALTVLARATIDAPVSRAGAVEILRAAGFDDAIFNDLVKSDVLRIEGRSVELVHEALADFLRAQDLAAVPPDVFATHIDSLPLQPGSLLPALLMALLPGRQLQQVLWQRLSEADFDVYLSVLRYRADTSAELAAARGDAATEACLLDILEGYSTPVLRYFPQLRRLLNESLSGKSVDELGIIGELSENQFVSYGFEPTTVDGERVRIGRPFQLSKSFGINLALSGYRLDSGRLVGMQRLKEGLSEAVDSRRLCGGLAWSRERLASRVSYMIEEGLLSAEAVALAWLRTTLAEHVDIIVQVFPFSREKNFAIQTILDDVAILEAAGDTTLDFWWQRLGWSPSVKLSEDTTGALLAECYRRAQRIYAELVEGSFAEVADHMGFYNCLPVRWTIELPPGDEWRWANYYWLPVRTWAEADAEVRFLPEGQRFKADGHFAKIDAELERLCRSRQHIRVSYESGVIPRFDGRGIGGAFDGETPALRLSCKWIEDDLDQLFHDLPGSDMPM